MFKSEQNLHEDTILESAALGLDGLLDWSTIDYTPILLNSEENILENQDETLDASTKFGLVLNEIKPVSPVGPPEREIFSGNLKFEVEICGADTNRSKFVYSHRLNRIYVDKGHAFSVQLKWDATNQPYPTMFVRATPVFSDQAQAEKRVNRCIQHYHDKNNDVTMTESMRGSVLHSTRDVGTLDVFYCGSESLDVWFSVVVRFAAPSTHAYQFACKNSCSSGINRRTIAIIFTLEDYTGKVYGRQSVGARVCSCPKRDMKREEEEEAPRGKRPLATNKSSPAVALPPLNKKIRLEVQQDESDDDDEWILPPLKMQGRRAIISALQVGLTVQEVKRSAARRYRQPTDQLDTYIAALKEYIEKCSNKQK